MEEVKVNLGPRSYPIYIDQDCIGELGKLLRDFISFNRMVIISDNTVSSLYGDMVTDSLSQAEFLPEVLVIPEGEQHKDFSTMRRIYDFLIEYNYPRQSTLLQLRFFYAFHLSVYGVISMTQLVGDLPEFLLSFFSL